jgi:hypothetical protein
MAWRGTYPEAMDPRTRRVIVSGVLLSLVVMVALAALWGMID